MKGIVSGYIGSHTSLLAVFSFFVGAGKRMAAIWRFGAAPSYFKGDDHALGYS
jgi:hypothetical protein